MKVRDGMDQLFLPKDFFQLSILMEPCNTTLLGLEVSFYRSRWNILPTVSRLWSG